MELIVFIGIQATGKSTFYKERFSDSHVRINLDMLKTRHRERRLFELCLELKQSCVIDNTNVTKQDRQRYLSAGLPDDVRVTGYYFSSKLKDALARNRQRCGAAAIPEKGVLGAYKRLELPALEEGFDHLYYVTIADDTFVVQDFS